MHHQSTMVYVCVSFFELLIFMFAKKSTNCNKLLPVCKIQLPGEKTLQHF